MAEWLLILSILALASFGVLAFITYRLVRSPMLLVATMLIGGWTMLGAIPLLVVKLDDRMNQATYLEGRLFAVLPDSDYLLTLVAYTIFLIVFALLVFALAPRVAGSAPSHDAGWRHVVLGFSHAKLLALCGAAILVEWWGLAQLLRADGGIPLYLNRSLRASRWEAYLTTGSSLALGIGLALLVLAWGSKRSFRGTTAAAYALLLVASFYASWIQGHRRLMLETLVTFVVALWALRSVVRRHSPRRWLARISLALGSLIGLVVVSVVGVTRGHAVGSSVSDDASYFGSSLLDVGALAGSWVGTAELYAAHISLFGVISHGVMGLSPVDWGFTYPIYARLVGAPSDQGFTIHPVAGWWLLVGPMAPIVAALAIAGMTLLCYRISLGDPTKLSGPLVASALTVSAFGLPSILMRGGPEAAWGAVLEIFVLPVAFLLWPWLGVRKR